MTTSTPDLATASAAASATGGATGGPAIPPGGAGARRARRARAAGLNAFGVLIALLTLFPLFWMISTAFKPSHEIYSLTPHLLPTHPTLGNFRQVISGEASGIGPVWLFFRNSLAVTLSTVVLASLVSLLASVAVARFRFRFRASFLIMLLIVQMIPGQALVIALFLDFKRLNLLQNLVGLVIVYSAQALPVSIWMLRNFVATIPKELEEAAAIDGASGFRIFWRILFPLVAPGLVATSIFSFITAYNEFIIALTFLGQAHSDYTLPIYVTYFFGRGGAEWGPIMAASTMYTVPVVIFFLIVRRRLVGGLVAGALKG
jgi:N,N'-diacetylchitobiose transport system permease protein